MPGEEQSESEFSGPFTGASSDDGGRGPMTLAEAALSRTLVNERQKRRACHRPTRYKYRAYHCLRQKKNRKRLSRMLVRNCKPHPPQSLAQ